MNPFSLVTDVKQIVDINYPSVWWPVLAIISAASHDALAIVMATKGENKLKQCLKISQLL